MNENLNLVEILKDCPKGTKYEKFYMFYNKYIYMKYGKFK